MKETRFKDTEIGKIPEDWKTCTVLSQSSKLVVAFVGTCEKYYTNKGEGVMMLRTGDLKEHSIDYTNIKYISYSFHNANKKSQLKKGDILIARHGSNGHGVIYDKNDEANSLNFVIVHLIDKEYLNSYLVYCLDTNIVREQIEAVTAGSTQKVINTKAIGELVVPKPNILEQQKIASALTSIDNLISSLGRLIEKKKNVKQGTMQQLLTGKTRLKGFSEPWVEKKLGEVGYTYNGISGKSANDFGHGNAQYITFLNILNNVKIDTRILEKVSIDNTENQNAVRKGDLLFNTSSETPEEVGVCSVLLQDLPNTYLNSFCFGYRIIDSELLGLYLSYYFRSRMGRKLMSCLAQGSTRYNLSKDAFLKSIITIPPTLSEQRAIASILTKMDDEITALEAKKAKYEAVKQGMMQQLLTGKIRLIG